MTTPERFTPGPWRFTDYTSGAFSIGDGHLAICSRTATALGLVETSIANGHLIAAAPDLYAVCIKQVEWLERLADRAEQQAKHNRFVTLKEAYVADAKNYRATAEHIKRALAKARGETA